MRHRILAIGVTLGLVTLVALQAQQTRTGDATAVMALTAMDYIQIKQLVNRRQKLPGAPLRAARRCMAGR